jgi:hypothetical protein
MQEGEKRRGIKVAHGDEHGAWLPRISDSPRAFPRNPKSNCGELNIIFIRANSNQKAKTIEAK